MVTGDKGMIKRILSNLFSNILKYGDKSSPVFIKGSFTKQSYILEISNTVKQQNTGGGKQSYWINECRKNDAPTRRRKHVL